ncbi:MAG: hypothetical protein M1837_007420 [Sclerophora amabilis]|nr:MAG: hypothetical protein M1837_007420 [Sclerophora amabilis]
MSLMLSISIVHSLSFNYGGRVDREGNPVRGFDRDGLYSYTTIRDRVCGGPKQLNNAIFFDSWPPPRPMRRLAQERGYVTVYDVCRGLGSIEQLRGNGRLVSLASLVFLEFASGTATVCFGEQRTWDRRQWEFHHFPKLVEQSNVKTLKAIEYFTTREPRHYFPGNYASPGHSRRFFDPPLEIDELAAEYTLWSQGSSHTPHTPHTLNIPDIFHRSPINEGNNEAYIDAHLTAPSANSAMFTAGTSGLSEWVDQSDRSIGLQAVWDNWNGDRKGLYKAIVLEKFASLASGDVFLFVPDWASLYDGAPESSLGYGVLWHDHVFPALERNQKVQRIIATRLHSGYTSQQFPILPKESKKGAFVQKDVHWSRDPDNRGPVEYEEAANVIHWE